jgi:hypothetical protein
MRRILLEIKKTGTETEEVSKYGLQNMDSVSRNNLGDGVKD